MKPYIAISALILCTMACISQFPTRPDTAVSARIALTAEYETAVVTAEVLRVRDTPSEKGAVVGYKYLDNTVTVYARTGTNWCLISEKSEAWVACWWLR